MKEVVWINLDETSIPRMSGGGKGYVVSRRNWAGARGPSRPAKKSLTRCRITHMAAIASRSDVQAKLPQVFLLNRRTVSAAEFAALTLPSGVHAWRRPTSWSTIETTLDILCLLAVCLEEFMHEVQFVILLDMAPCHLSARVVERAAELGFYLAYIPARCTSLVQPLDAMVLGPYKDYIFKRMRKREVGGELSVQAWFDCLVDGCKHFLNARKWNIAFEKTGVLQTGCLSRSLSSLELATPSQPVEFPSPELIYSTFPQGKGRGLYTGLFSGFAGFNPPLLT